MNALLKEISHNPLLWLLVFVPVVFIAAKLRPEAHSPLFVLSVLAIVPLAALLSHATESVAAKTGDAVGGLLNATLGNLTELVIALTALRAGEYMLVKASIAGAIVTNTLVHAGRILSPRRPQAPRAGIQPRRRAPAGGSALPRHRRPARCPSAVAEADIAQRPRHVTQKLSVGLAVLLIVGLRARSCSSPSKPTASYSPARPTAEEHEAPWPIGLAAGDAGRRDGAGRAGQRDFRRVGAEGGRDVRDERRPLWASSSLRWWAARRRWPRRFPAPARTAST